MKPKVGILTTFTDCDEAYSLVNVVKVQLRMLLDADYSPVLFVAPTFSGDDIWSEKYIEIRKVAMPNAKCDEIHPILHQKVSDIDVMLCHDIVFLGQHREWAETVRKLTKVHPIAWLHWQHSRGGHTPIEPVGNSWYCYPNEGDLGHVAWINSTVLDRVRYIPHPLDFDYLGWDRLAIRIAEETGFPFVNVSAILPTRMDRQKQVEKAVRLFAGIKRAGKIVRFLIANAYATGEKFIEYKKDILKIAEEQGLTTREVIFLGDRYEECGLRTPRETVKSLYEMSNIFILPSNSETSSLVAMEAALAGNLLIINADFPPIHHLYRKALSLPFGSIFEDTRYYRNVVTADGVETKVDDPQQFWDDQAVRTVLPVLEGQLALSVKRQQLRERWPSLVFKNHLEPLILEATEEIKDECR
jgi:glycosyltransferase involved in cell wall biosynthesis